MSETLNKKAKHKSVDKDIKDLENHVRGLNFLKKNPPNGFHIKLEVSNATGLLSANLIRVIGDE